MIGQIIALTFVIAVGLVLFWTLPDGDSEPATISYSDLSYSDWMDRTWKYDSYNRLGDAPDNYEG